MCDSIVDVWDFVAAVSTLSIVVTFCIVVAVIIVDKFTIKG